MKIYFPILLVCFTSLCQARSVPLAPHEPALHRREVDEVGSVSDSAQALKDILAKDLQATAAKASGAKSYMIDQTNSWTVGANEDCQPEIGPQQTFGAALICQEEGGANCKLTAAIKNTESFTDTMGFTSSFSVEAGGTIGGAVNVKATMSSSTTETYAHTYGQETSITYEFPVPMGKRCTPSRVSYRMKCKGSSWHVNGESVKTDCSKLESPIGFSDMLRIFKGPDGHFYYVNHRADGTSELYEMVTNGYAPERCEDVTDGVWVRQMELRRSKDTEEPLSYTDGKSLSAIACIFAA
ncbi:hypothetical protein BGZ88_000954 [Linnemannia elongata]|nr:hypothetical protein BGZ88_000954 [Linnemannia elongata]